MESDIAVEDHDRNDPTGKVQRQGLAEDKVYLAHKMPSTCTSVRRDGGGELPKLSVLRDCDLAIAKQHRYMRELRVLFETIRRICKLSGAEYHAHVATAFSDVFTNVHKC